MPDSSLRHLFHANNNVMRTVFFLAILLFLAEQSHQGWARALLATDSPPGKSLIVTSDSKAYCKRLDIAVTQHIHLAHTLPAATLEDVRMLQTQGQALCDHAHIRAGIERLRHALVLLKQEGKPHK